MRMFINVPMSILMSIFMRTRAVLLIEIRGWKNLRALSADRKRRLCRFRANSLPAARKATHTTETVCQTATYT